MAFVVKNVNSRRVAGPTSGAGQAVLQQWIQVSRPALVLPQSTTQQLFRIYGGRVLVHLLLGEVTVVMTSTDPGLSIDYAALTNASALVGTAYALASTLNIASDEVGTLFSVEGDGSAIISGNQVAGTVEAFSTGFVAAQGEIYATTTGNNTTGQIKWDLWYQPLDAGAYVSAVSVATAAI